MQMTNDEVDRAILDRLENDMGTLRDIHTVLERPGKPSDDRLLDRRLSALKKAGQICHLRKSEGGPGWVIVVGRVH